MSLHACHGADAVLRDAGAAFGVSADVLSGAEAARQCATCPVVTDLQRRLDRCVLDSATTKFKSGDTARVVVSLTLPSLRRTGFHRLLVTHLQVQVPAQQAASAPCQVALLERLTRDVYCDTYEVARLHQAAAAVRVFGDYQVERPAPECQGSVVSMVLAGQAAELNADGRMLVNASAVLPIHARYPGPVEPGQETLLSVVIAPPVVLLRCGTGPGAAWRVASAMAETQPLVWKVRASAGCGAGCIVANRLTPRLGDVQVPAGKAGSAAFVGAVTRAATYTAAVAVLAAMATHGQGQQRPRVKAA